MATKTLEIDSPIVTTLTESSKLEDTLTLASDDKSEINVSINLSSIIELELDNG